MHLYLHKLQRNLLLVPGMLAAITAVSLTPLVTPLTESLAKGATPSKTAGVRGIISVFTYASGGPHHAKGLLPLSNATVQVRRAQGANTLVGKVKHAAGGHAMFVIRPGTYSVEATLASPEVRPARRCGSPKTVTLVSDKTVTVKLYCSIP